MDGWIVPFILNYSSHPSSQELLWLFLLVQLVLKLEVRGYYFLQVFLHVNVTGNKYYIFTTGTKSIQIAAIPFF